MDCVLGVSKLQQAVIINHLNINKSETQIFACVKQELFQMYKNVPSTW